MLVARHSRRSPSSNTRATGRFWCENLEPRRLFSLASVHIADYFPLADGNTWSYAGTLGNPGVAATATLASHANVTEQGRTVTTLDLEITDGTHTRSEVSYYAHTLTGLRLFRIDTTANSTVMVRITGGARVLPPDPVIDTDYTFTRDLTGSISPQNVTFTGTTSGTVTLVDFEQLTTEVGTYSALKETVNQTYTESLSNGTTQTGTITKTVWLIKGIGIGRVLYHESSSNSGGGSSTHDWDLTLSDTPLATQDPRLQVFGNSFKIAAGDTTPRRADNTAFGAVDVNGDALGHNFILTNTGAQPLTLAAISAGNYVGISGPNAADFSVVIQPARTTLQPGQSTFFRVRYNPSTAGVSDATLTIDSNSAANSAYSFAVRGTGVLLGRISVSGGSVNHAVSDGSLVPSALNGTAFGATAAAGSSSLTSTFTITNTGAGELDLLSTPSVQITGLAASDFSVTASPSTAIASGNSTTFTITFDPSAVGFRFATVRIHTNDRLDPVFTFRIKGRGI